MENTDRPVIFEPCLSADGSAKVSLPMEILRDYFTQWKHGTQSYDPAKFQVYQGDPDLFLKQIRQAKALEILSSILGYDVESFDMRLHVIGTDFYTATEDSQLLLG